MKNALVLMLMILITGISPTTWAQPQPEGPEQNVQKQEALRAARQHKWAIRGQDKHGRTFELMRLHQGRPQYYITDNANAAISSGAAQIRSTEPYNVDGGGMLAGVWDGGWALSTHQELTGRINVMDSGGSVIDHATHVAGTIAASGVVANAKGMAPAATVRSFDWNSDTTEMAAQGATSSGQAGKITISNHSYGNVCGWVKGTYAGTAQAEWNWFGIWGELEDQQFGQYDDVARSWDIVCVDHPYYLPFKSAGNDRSDPKPNDGDTFYYYDNGWVEATFDSATAPYADNWDDGGYDTIATNGCAKNVLTVGAVGDAVSGSARSLSGATMSSFSCWGPTDDGRIKPDLVANGVGLYSSTAGGDTSYASYNGTSMATPNASGSALLLQELYGDLNSGATMTSAMLKGLLIHTADDLGNTGPDYQNGWGLINVKAAADVICAASLYPSVPVLVQSTLSAGTSTRQYDLEWDGASPITVTLCWTDPAATALYGLDQTSSRLVNDLDVRLEAPGGGTTYLPWVLDPTSPATAATTGDNSRDNVEQVLLASPTVAGTYTVTVSYKGSLSVSSQSFALILSGQATEPLNISPDEDYETSGQPGGPYSPASKVYTLTNQGDATLNWTCNASENWVAPSPASGSLAVDASVQVTVSPTAQADLLDTGEHEATLTFTNESNGIEQIRQTVLTIADRSVEFDAATSSASEGAGTVNIPVSLSAVSSASAVSLQYAVTAGTAQAETDYHLLGTGTLSIPAGNTSGNIQVQILDDGIDEPDESLTITLSSPTTATLGTVTQHVLTIEDNDPAAQVGFGDTSSLEQLGEDAGTVYLPISLNQPGSAQGVSLHYEVTQGRELLGGDVDMPSSGTIELAVQDSSAQLPLTILEDETDEDDQSIEITLSDPSGAVLSSQAVVEVTIQDNDQAPTVQFQSSRSYITEADTTLELVVEVGPGLTEKTVQVDYQLGTGDVTTGVDLEPLAGTLTIVPPQTTGVITVHLLDDTDPDGQHSFLVELSGPVQATLGEPAIHTVTVFDDELKNAAHGWEYYN